MTARLVFLLSLLTCAGCSAPPVTPEVATFSIVAYDAKTQELGVAVQSKVPAVGAIVPWAKAGVGAVATQAFANTTYGPRGLELLAGGKSPLEAIDALVAADAGKPRRQVGVVDAQGRAAAFTGENCFDWAGQVTGEGFTCQGNLLAGEAVVQAMAKAFVETEGVLAERLLAALEAGQAAGGDKRGRQSAALLIVREGWGYGGYDDRLRDLRVDDHPTPIKELRRVYGVHKGVFRRPPAPAAPR